MEPHRYHMAERRKHTTGMEPKGRGGAEGADTALMPNLAPQPGLQ